MYNFFNRFNSLSCSLVNQSKDAHNDRVTVIVIIVVVVVDDDDDDDDDYDGDDNYGLLISKYVQKPHQPTLHGSLSTLQLLQ